MDEINTHRTPNTTHTTINRTEPRPSGTGSAIWFLLGGVVVVVAIMAYVVLGEGQMTTEVADPAPGNTSISVETMPAPADDPAQAPASDPQAPATEQAAPEAAPAPVPQSD